MRARQGFLTRISAGSRPRSGRSEPLSLAGLAVSGAGLSVLGMALLMGRSRGVGRAGAIVSASCLFGVAILSLVPVWRGGRGAPQRAAALAVTALTWIFAVWTTLGTLAPGPSWVRANVLREGERIAVPAEVEGRVQVRVSGGLPDKTAGYLSFTISGVQPPIEGVLQRSVGHVTSLGRRAHTVIGDTSSVHQGVLHGTPTLVVERLRGQVVRPLLIEILPPGPSSVLVIVLGIHLLLVGAVVAARQGLPSEAWALGAVGGGAMGVHVFGHAGATIGSAVFYLATGAVLGMLPAALIARIAR